MPGLMVFQAWRPCFERFFEENLLLIFKSKNGFMIVDSFSLIQCRRVDVLTLSAGAASASSRTTCPKSSIKV